LPDAIDVKSRATFIPARPVASQDHEVKLMGDAAVRMRVMPESTDVDLEKLAEDIKKAVPSFARMHAIEQKPIAFGLKALIVVTIMDDKGGRSPDEIEEAVRRLPGVESVEVEEVGLI
jgi:elongation factor 1-beta